VSNEPPAAERLSVEIWSDVVCPWCYIGKRRFETAVAASVLGPRVDVTWRSFQLNPDHPRGVRRHHDEYLAAKLGGSVEQVKQLDQRVTALAAAEGLVYDFDRYVVVNTFDAHRVAHLAASRGLGEAIEERLLRGQLVEGEILDEAATLVRLAGEIGVPAPDVEAVLAGDEFTREVEDDIRTGLALGLTGVPFFVFDRAIGVSGAQPAEVFVRALELAAERAGSGAPSAAGATAPG
jgi:predicted DsbA family dithiol-disulfide isomerase